MLCLLVAESNEQACGQYGNSSDLNTQNSAVNCGHNDVHRIDYFHTIFCYPPHIVMSRPDNVRWRNYNRNDEGGKDTH